MRRMYFFQKIHKPKAKIGRLPSVIRTVYNKIQTKQFTTNSTYYRPKSTTNNKVGTILEDSKVVPFFAPDHCYLEGDYHLLIDLVEEENGLVMVELASNQN